MGAGKAGSAAMALRPALPAPRRERLGIVGGMGPLAAIDFQQRLIAHSIKRMNAVRDQDHIPLILNSAPDIPDRTAAILDGGLSPLPDLLEAVRELTSWGATYLAITCNTAHYWYDELQSSTAAPILHIADAACAEAKHKAGPNGTMACWRRPQRSRYGSINRAWRSWAFNGGCLIARTTPWRPFET